MHVRPAEELNNTARVLLGMIAEGHATGYAIKAEIERSTRLYWGASVGGIYPELRRLTKAGLVSVCDDPRGGTRRHSYTLTAAGDEALREWLTDTLGARAGDALRAAAAAALRRGAGSGAAARGRTPDARGLRVTRRKRCVERLELGEFDDPFHRMTAEFGLAYYEWGRDWCAGAERGCWPTAASARLPAGAAQRIAR